MELHPNDAYALRLIIAQKPIPEIELTPLVKALTLAFKPENLSALLTVIPPSSMVQIMAIDPDSPAPHQTTSQVDDDQIDFPALPDFAQLSEESLKASEKVGLWLDQFVNWSSQRSHRTPKVFLESGGLWALALLTAGRAYLPMKFGRLAPNLYLMWVAASGYYAKTTGMSAVEDFINAIAPHLLTASTNTPEALFAELAGQLPSNFDKLSKDEQESIQEGLKFGGQRGMVVDEAARLFLNKKSLEGLTQDLLLLFNGGTLVKNQVGTGRIRIPYATFNIFGATTEPQFSYIGQMAWEDGLIARFAMVYPPEKVIPYTTTTEPTNYDPPEDLLAIPRAIYNYLPLPPEKGAKRELVPMSIDQYALEAYNHYHRAMLEMSQDVDTRLKSNYIRFHNQVLKVAMLLALTDHAEKGWVGTPRVLGGHFAKAQIIGEKWRYSLHQILQVTQLPEETRAQESILNLLRRKGGLTRRDILKSTSIKNVKILDSALELLIESGSVVLAQKESGLSGGRPTSIYKIPSEFIPKT